MIEMRNRLYTKLIILLPAVIFSWCAHSWGQTVYSDLDHSSLKSINLIKNNKHKNFNNREDSIFQLMKGIDYTNGWTVQPDISAACDWYAKAASREIPLAQHYYAICVSKKLISSDVSSSSIFKKSIEGGHLLSSCYLADILLAETENKKLSIYYISQCEYLAQLGAPIASFRMYKLLAKKDGDKVVTEKALNFLLGAAQDEIPEAKLILGKFLIEISKNKEEFSLGLKLLEDAASLGFAPAFDVIAQIYLFFLNEKNYGYSKRYLLEKSYLWSSSALTRNRELELKYGPHVENLKKLIPNEVVEGLDKLRENYLLSVSTSLAPFFH